MALAVARERFGEYDAIADRASRFDRDGWNALLESPFAQGFVPVEYGGLGWDALTRAYALEAFGEGCRDNGLSLGFSALVCTILPPLLTFGSDDQINRYLPRLLSGDCIAADCITEAEAGSDAMAMRSKATPNESGYLLEGGKRYIGFAPIADLLLVYAKTDPEAGAWGLSAFLVDSNLPGVRLSENKEKMGLRTLPMGDIDFERCQLPEGARLGGEGAGLSLFNESMEWERAMILATQVGVLKRQLEESVAHARSRQQFGNPISSFQSVSNRIAEQRLRLENCRLHLYRTCWLLDQGQSVAAEAAMTKLSISEALLASSIDSLRNRGAQGYLEGSTIERDLRDAAGGILYAGTSDIQRNLIARMTGL